MGPTPHAVLFLLLSRSLFLKESWSLLTLVGLDIGPDTGLTCVPLLGAEIVLYPHPTVSKGSSKRILAIFTRRHKLKCPQTNVTLKVFDSWQGTVLTNQTGVSVSIFQGSEPGVQGPGEGMSQDVVSMAIGLWKGIWLTAGATKIQPITTQD